MDDKAKRPKVYNGLLERMAWRLGIHLRQQLDDGHIGAKTVEHMMSHCSVCDHDRRCRADLAKPGVIQGTAPDYCQNRKLLDALAEWERDAIADSARTRAVQEEGVGGESAKILPPKAK